MYRCLTCRDYRWVCWKHPDRPWNDGKGCGCGAEGAPCPDCNLRFPAEDPPLSHVYARTKPKE